ncbi:MAG: hypothetical protein OEZ68_13065 [Gammaproteobacteria bacterium]|nr:hypothetical protein [Gammaproteobacteria bacterium]MDH5801729.1 hypothetical protein [Gammaproteobacteria bacterium]
MDYSGHTQASTAVTHVAEHAVEIISPTDFMVSSRPKPRIQAKTKPSLVERLATPQPIRIYTLGRFSINMQNQDVNFCSKGQRKALELLKTLIAFGGREVGEIRICEALWPDSDGDVAHTTFSVTLHRLRKLLGNDTLVLSDGRLTLNAEKCWVDVWSVERLIGQIRQILNSSPVDAGKIADLVHQTMSMYHGPYLGNEDEQPWFLSYRQKLHTKFFRTVMQVCRYLEQNDQCDVAVNLYEYGIEIDNLSETTYLHLMKCYIKQGKYSEAMRVYQRCSNILQAHFGMGVSHEMRSLHRSLKQCA